MTVVRTDLRDTRDRARTLRFEQTPLIGSTDVQSAIEEVGAQAAGSFTPTLVAAADSPYTVQSSDVALYVDTTAGAVTINLQPQAARSLIPLQIKDTGGMAGTNVITVTPSGAETIDGQAPALIDSNFGGLRLNPKTGGYTVAP